MTTTNTVTYNDLNTEQKAFVDDFKRFLEDSRPAIALSGPAGTGKSTVLGVALTEVPTGVTVTGSALTNRASSVLREITKQPVSTVHSVLGLTPRPCDRTGTTRLVRKSEPKVPANSVLLIDEVSMVGQQLLDMLIDIQQELNLKLVFVGDSYQLAPVMERPPKAKLNDTCTPFTPFTPFAPLTTSGVAHERV